MPLVPGVDFELFYTGKNITADVSETLIDLSYTDNIKGKADEVELTFDDTKRLWCSTWYPQKGDIITVRIGADGKFLECGDFRIDETTQKNPPRTFAIKGLATFLTKALRTKNHFAHEDKTLLQIAQAICDKHGLTLDQGSHTVTLTKNVLGYSSRINEIRNQLFVGMEQEPKEQTELMFKLATEVGGLERDLKADDLTDQGNKVGDGFRWTANHISKFGFRYYVDLLLKVENSLFAYRNNPTQQVVSNDLGSVIVHRETQASETDLEFLSRIALKYGFIFNVKGTTMLFYMLSSLDDRPHSASFTAADLSGYSITTKTSGTYKDATVTHHDWENQELITATATEEGSADPDGETQIESTSDDTLEIHTRVENQQQAEAVAKAGLKDKNKAACSGSIDGAFNIQCCAGNNVKIYDIGEDSGIFQISTSTFKLNKSSGNTFSAEVKRVAFVSKADKILQ
jgi:phage protein D